MAIFLSVFRYVCCATIKYLFILLLYGADKVLFLLALSTYRVKYDPDAGSVPLLHADTADVIAGGPRRPRRPKASSCVSNEYFLIANNQVESLIEWLLKF